MVDRITLLGSLVYASDRHMLDREAVRSALDSALGVLLVNTPLPAVIELPSAQREDVCATLSGGLGDKVIADLAKAWEPQRKVDADLKSMTRRHLVDLVSGRRRPYEKIKPMPLPEARSYSGDTHTALSLVIEIGPYSEVKALLTKWDKHGDSAQLPAAQARERACALLKRTVEPAPSPAPPPKQTRKKSKGASGKR
jgi:hypothetical protein